MTSGCLHCHAWEINNHKKEPVNVWEVLVDSGQCWIPTLILSWSMIFFFLIPGMTFNTYGFWLNVIRATICSCLLTVTITTIYLIYHHGRTWFKNNLIGTTVHFIKDVNGDFHEHDSSNSLDGEFLSYRVGGYFRSLGSISPSRRKYWKIMSSWSVYGFILADNYGGQVKCGNDGGYSKMNVVETYYITQEATLASYLYLRTKHGEIKNLRKQLEAKDSKNNVPQTGC